MPLSPSPIAAGRTHDTKGLKIVERFCRWKFQEEGYIQFSALTKNSCENRNCRPSGRNRTCDHAILVLPSNKLSYRVQLLNSNQKLKIAAFHMHIVWFLYRVGYLAVRGESQPCFCMVAR